MTESIQILMEKDRLQPLADNIKVLKGSDSITLQQMEDTIEETNTDIVSQTDLITQLANALQGKSVPGGGGEDVTAETETYTDLLTDLEAAVEALPDAGSGSGGVETCTLTCTSTLQTHFCYQPALGEVCCWLPEEPGDVLGSVEIVCGSMIYGPGHSSTAENATYVTDAVNLWLVTAPAGGTVTFL